ncbi:unnamed protein product [Victoria cruziana]
MDRNCGTALSLLLPLVLLTSSAAQAYKNYTVGDDLGWYDNTEKKINYQKWISGKEFSLGDFLIFNTDTNHSVVQTYNFTIYKRCDFDDADSKDTTEYSSSQGDLKQQTGPWTIAIPLKKEGMNYFFSSFYDGEQCRNGQRFRINVAHGQGLPESLKDPVAASSPAPQAQQDDDTSTPDTTNVPGDFNKRVPSSSSDSVQTSGSTAGSVKSAALGILLSGALGILI